MKDGERVDSGIIRRPSGRYSVQVSVNNEHVKGTFDTLKEARAYRDHLRATRPKRVYKKQGIAGVMDGLWGPPKDLETRRDENRRLIQNAPRKKVIINGEEFMLVTLPPQAQAAA